MYDVSSIVYPDAFSPRYKNAVAAAGHRACCQHPQNHSQQSKNPNRWSRCQRKHVHQNKPLPRTPKSLGWILPRKGISHYQQVQHTCSNCKRDCEVQISPEKALESDESDKLRYDVEISRRRRLLVVSIDSSSLLFKTHGATVPRKPPRMASSAIIACVESSPTYQPGQSQRARGVLRRLVSLH